MKVGTSCSYAYQPRSANVRPPGLVLPLGVCHTHPKKGIGEERYEEVWNGKRPVGEGPWLAGTGTSRPAGVNTERP